MDEKPKYGVRESRLEGWFVPQIDGIDLPVTTFDYDRALNIARLEYEERERRKKVTDIPSFEDWISENGSDVEREWRFIHDEYGDAAPLLSAFKMQRYREAFGLD